MRPSTTGESPPGYDAAPGGTEGLTRRGGGREASVAAATDHAAHFRARVLVEALLDGWTIHNGRQARRWEASRPRSGDFLGASTPEDQRARWHRMTAVATAYRHRSSIAPLQELSVDLVNVLTEDRGAVA